MSRVPQIIRRIFGALRRRARERQSFASTAGWIWANYSRILFHLPHVPLPGRRRVVNLALTKLKQPLPIRLGTTDVYVMEEIFSHEEYLPISLIPRELLRVIIDLGANAGMSIRYWREFFPRAEIIAVEPDAGNLAMCRRNAACDQPPAKTQLVQACIGGRTRTAFLDRSRHEWAFRMTDQVGDGGIPVPVITMDDLLRQSGIQGEIDLLKVDIEGAEAEVFAACGPWIGRVRYLVVETHPPYSGAKFLADLAASGAGFSVLRRSSNGGEEVLFLHRSGPVADSAVAANAGGG